MNITVFEPVTRLAWKVRGKVIKHAPEILLGAGLASMVGGAILACKETMNAEEILDHTKERLDKIHEVEELQEKGELAEPYTQQAKAQDLVNVYARTAGQFVKLYAPAVALEAVGIACICGSYGIMRKRQVALTAAYTALQTGFSEYRRRVREKLGDEEDLYFQTGLHPESVKTVNADGKNDVVEAKVFEGNPGDHSLFDRWFDETCDDFTRDPMHNLNFLVAQQKHANRLLQRNGYLFLNDVYDLIGIPRCPQGQAVGWMRDGLTGGCGFVDFGIYDGWRETARNFVNGYEKSILLKFNIDPEPIWDKL